MPASFFLNLSVRDLEKTKAFFTALGYSFDPEFTNEDAACLVIGDTVYAMLHTHDSLQRFTKKEIADAQKITEGIFSLSVGNRETVDIMLERALSAGAVEVREPEDHGWMYARSFEDPDGHQWEYFYMDGSGAPHHA